jgi:putative transposase
VQRWKGGEDLKDKRRGPLTAPANRLTSFECAKILETANKPEFGNLSPSQLVPKLADLGCYVGSVSSVGRVLKKAKQLQHRSASRPKKHKKPEELMATKPNELWSWDITYLPTLIKGKHFYLYLFLDIFSRKIVGYNVFDGESAEHAATTFKKIYKSEGLTKDKVTLHSDNGKPMKGVTMLATLQTLGVMPSFSRPSVSDDNPFSESLFKTMKYHPWYPTKPFETLQEARVWVESFTAWYNHIHLHSSIQFVTPDDRHQGRDKAILENRRRVFEEAKQKNPNRWSGKTRNWDPIDVVYLNKKKTGKNAEVSLSIC